MTVACGYLALGYAYTKWKATGQLRARAARRGRISAALATALTVACLVAVDGTAAPLNLHNSERIIGFAGLLTLAAAAAVTALVTLRPRIAVPTALPIAGLVTATVALVVALVVARYPVLVPSGLTARRRRGADVPPWRSSPSGSGSTCR